MTLSFRLISVRAIFRVVLAGAATSSLACDPAKSAGVEQARVNPDAGSDASTKEVGAAAATVVPACADPVAASAWSPIPVELALPSWFVPAEGATCADTPGALVMGVAVAPTQEIVLVGSFIGSADFGNGALAYLQSDQVFLAAFKADGQPKWSRALQGTTASVAVDTDGNVVVLRAWTGALNQVGGTGTVDSFDLDGTLRWTRDIPFGPNSERRGMAIAATAAGAVSVAVPGRVVTLDSSGQIVQEQDYSYVAPIGLGIGAEDDRLLGGIGTVAYDPLRISAFVARLNPLDQELWRVPITTPDSSGALQDLRVATGPGIAVSGAFTDQVSVGKTVLRSADETPAAPGASAANGRVGEFLAKIDTQGNVIWARETGSAALGTLQSLAFDDAGAMIVAASSTTAATLTVSGLDCRGDRAWAQAFSGFADAQVIVAPVSGSTDIVLAGSTNTSYVPTCETCCYAPRPYLIRVARDGTLTPGFHAHR